MDSKKIIKGSLMSDLHLEFKAICDLPGNDFLILSGDTWTVSAMRPNAQDATSRALRKRYIKFCKEELSKYKKVYIVPGNHEYYHGILEDTVSILDDFLAMHCPHAIVLNNEFDEWEGIRFIGSTFWSTYGKGTPYETAIQLGTNDCVCIRTREWLEDYPPPSKGRTFIVSDFYHQHYKASLFVKDALEESKLPCVVMTHHAPSYLCLEGGHCNNLDDAYASNQHILMKVFQPVMWTYGHTHVSMRKKVYDTLVVSNQRGYFGSERCANFFDPSAADFTLNDIKERKLFINGENVYGTTDEA